MQDTSLTVSLEMS